MGKKNYYIYQKLAFKILYNIIFIMRCMGYFCAPGVGNNFAVFSRLCLPRVN